jgi:hypothetical protein
MDGEMREKLAGYAHESWSGWMKYLFEKSQKNADGTVTIPKWAVDRWERQAATPYCELPETEKISDRDEADKMLKITRHPDLGYVIQDGCLWRDHGDWMDLVRRQDAIPGDYIHIDDECYVVESVVRARREDC